MWLTLEISVSVSLDNVTTASFWSASGLLTSFPALSGSGWDGVKLSSCCLVSCWSISGDPFSVNLCTNTEISGHKTLRLKATCAFRSFEPDPFKSSNVNGRNTLWCEDPTQKSPSHRWWVWHGRELNWNMFKAFRVIVTIGRDYEHGL